MQQILVPTGSREVWGGGWAPPSEAGAAGGTGAAVPDAAASSRSREREKSAILGIGEAKQTGV